MRAWMHRGWLACLLWPLSMLMAAVVLLRRTLYRSGLKRVTRLPVPVVVVGNVFIGGTGKTPLAVWLVEALRRAGYRPGVISRGYGAAQSQARRVTAASQPHEVGDEPLLIAERTGCPVMVGRRRAAVGQALLAAHPDVNIIISDDGLQHYALARDVEIILSDARGNGNGWLLPAGPLREPASRRRDFTVFNDAGAQTSVSGQGWTMRLLADQVEQLHDRSIRRSLISFRTAGSIAAVAGIGNPARFFATLRQAGLNFESVVLPDHDDFSQNPFSRLTASVILITEKDAVKCRTLEAIKNDARIWVVPVTASIDGALAEQIMEKLRERPIA